MTDSMIQPQTRPAELRGKTKKTRVGCGNLFVTMNVSPDGRLREIFCNMGKTGGCASALCEALGRLISLVLRCGIEPHEIVKQLAGIRCHSPVGLGPAKVLSCADAIARVISAEIGFSSGNGRIEENGDRGACPDCGARLTRTGGCFVCESCGFSSCG